MKNLIYLAVSIAASAAVLAPSAFADTSSLSVQSVLPGTSVLVSNKLSFSILSPSFVPNAYQVSDSFVNSTVAANDITGAGNFAWVPVASDVGTHTLSISATDSSGDMASTVETIIVGPAPSVSVGALSPGNTIMPGTKLMFFVSATGFTNPSYILNDIFSGSSITDSNIDASGHVTWTPADISQDGAHTINVYVYDSLGHGASVNVAVQVGAGPQVTIQLLSPGTSISPQQTLSFTINGSAFSPTSFSVSDNFPNSTITNANTNSSGAFDWVPQASDIGTHVLTITGTIGVYGQSASTTERITVLGAAATPASLATAAAGFTFTTSLYSGMQNSDVTKLQTLLSQLGFFSGVPSGYFGPLTVAAVEKFQAAHNLAQLGVVGPATRAALNALNTGSHTTSATASAAFTSSNYTFQNSVTFGESGPDVLALQKRLAALGFFSGVPSGYFGDATLAAIMQFQQAKGIAPVDQLGPLTRAALNQ